MKIEPGKISLFKKLQKTGMVLISFLILLPGCREEQSNEYQQPQAGHENMVHLTPQQEILANIGVDSVRTGIISQTTLITGTVAADENKINVISARIGGRIERLLVKEPGQYVRKGALLFEIYSESLIADEKDYINLLNQRDITDKNVSLLDEMISSARYKLELWGLSNAEIEKIKSKREARLLMGFYSDKSGYLTELNVREGQSVREGDPVLSLTELENVWVEAQLYSGEQKLLENNPEIDVVAEQVPGKTFQGKTAYFNPILEAGKKIWLVRITVDNKEHLLVPGMYADVRVRTAGKEALLIPNSAIIPGKMPMVWIRSAPGMYEMKMIMTGISDDKKTEVLSGLKKGELVVNSGVYLLNSEYILKNGAGNIHHHH